MPDDTHLSSSGGNDRLQIGEWTVEPALHRITRAGKSVKLEPKAMLVLRYLADRPGQVVSREALLAAAWPGVVVGDDSVTQAIIKLRRALGDTAEAPTYIQTIAKSGYRLVAPVQRPQTAAYAPPAAPSEPLRAVASKRGPVWWAAGVIVSLTAAVVIWAALADRGNKPRGASAEIASEAVRAAQPTISVKPFQAPGEDPQAVLLAQGITADLVTDLSKVSGLSVVSAAGTGGVPRPPAGAHDAAIGYFVSGSVQRVGERLRLYVHLTDATTGKQLWAERYDRALSDLFAIQDELGPKILGVLPAKVTEAELRRVAQHHTRNLEAYELFQRGQMALLVRQQPENETARELFNRAIELDPKFARAYAALALTYAADYRNQWTGDGTHALTRASELARTAHEINPDVRETYWVLAFVHLERRQYEEALNFLETAIRVSPSFADAYAFMAGIRAYTGKPAEALPLLRTALRLNADAGYLYYLILGRAYFGLGDLEQARVNLQHALLRNPVDVEARVYLAASLLLSGNRASAEWEAEEIRALRPTFSSRAWLATHPLADEKVRTMLVNSLAALRF